MLCDRCHQHPAQILLQQEINGQKTSQHLCPHCYQEEQGIHDPFQLFSAFAQNPQGALLQSLLNTDAAQSPARSRQSLRCSNCGTPWEEVRQSGLFGCALCYDSFADLMPDLARKLHGHDAHVEDPDSVHEGEDKERALQEQDELQKLQQELKSAVAEEAYEEAARLRDAIKAFQGEKEDDSQKGEDHA